AAEAAREAMPMHQPRPAPSRRKGPFIDLDGGPASVPARGGADDTGSMAGQREAEGARRHGFRMPGLGLFVRHEPRPVTGEEEDPGANEAVDRPEAAAEAASTVAAAPAERVTTAIVPAASLAPAAESPAEAAPASVSEAPAPREPARLLRHAPVRRSAPTTPAAAG